MSIPSATPSALKKLSIDRTAISPKKQRRWVKLGLLLLVLVVLASVALMPGKVEVQAVSVITTYPSQQYAQLTASGYVVAQRRAAVASKATGRLVELNVREGSQVKKGDILARLDASDVQAAIAQSQAGFDKQKLVWHKRMLNWSMRIPNSNAYRLYARRGLYRNKHSIRPAPV
jgi:multidrug resistance efflux pump